MSAEETDVRHKTTSMPYTYQTANPDSITTTLVYHSSFGANDGTAPSCAVACGCPLLPLKQKDRAAEPAEDIVDEAINTFRANVLFRSFEVKSGADKLLIYLTFFISLCLKRLEPCKSKADGQRAMMTLSLEGDTKLVVDVIATPQTKDEAVCRRLLEKCYLGDGTQNKFWLAFAKRKFMNKTVG
eukprot:jgi/Chlat1/2722/Chrsp182S02894